MLGFYVANNWRPLPRGAWHSICRYGTEEVVITVKLTCSSISPMLQNRQPAYVEAGFWPFCSHDLKGVDVRMDEEGRLTFHPDETVILPRTIRFVDVLRWQLVSVRLEKKAGKSACRVVPVDTFLVLQ